MKDVVEKTKKTIESACKLLDLQLGEIEFFFPPKIDDFQVLVSVSWRERLGDKYKPDHDDIYLGGRINALEIDKTHFAKIARNNIWQKITMEMPEMRNINDALWLHRRYPTLSLREAIEQEKKDIRKEKFFKPFIERIFGARR